MVSIVLPTYNSAGTLDRSVTSVLNQTFKDFELIVIDDGSTDDTDAVLGKFTGLDSIRLISTVHRGCAAARNTGIAASKGALIAFQDSDDEWLPTKLEKAVALLRGTGHETGVFYSNMTMIGLDGSVTDFPSPRVRKGVLISDDTLDYQVFCIGIQSAVVKQECFGKIGLFDVALSRLIDLDLLTRLSDAFEFVHSTEPLVNFYVGDGISADAKALVDARRYLIEKYRLRLDEKSHYLARQYLLLAAALCEAGESFQGLAMALRGMLIAPWQPRILSEVLRTFTRVGSTTLAGILPAVRKSFAVGHAQRFRD